MNMRIFLGFLLPALSFVCTAEPLKEEIGKVTSQLNVGALYIHRCIYTVEITDLVWVVEGCGANLEVGKKYTFVIQTKVIGLRNAKGKIYRFKTFGKTTRQETPIPVVVVSETKPTERQ